ncbi:uncharacterized protein LOC113028757 [Astatotilapia calliptera]|uniref:uncharacterized protein LOC113028757 n=1 Tax=Astatotilapia calliptera TaxID=8154 RepID=UPI000E4296E0|nr:uncharacterized protein LOC113028757 [Astatotilapia calliptera]
MKLMPCFMLYVLLAAGTSLAVDVNWLTEVVKAIRKEYKIAGQFCLAAIIPLQQDTNTLREILSENSYKEKVETVIGEKNFENSQVYVSNNMVIARVLKPEHAELRVLQKLEQLSQNSAGNFLLLYSYLSPCSTCTDIMGNNNIHELINSYKDRAFVFTKVYDKSNSETQNGRTISREELINSLHELASLMGLRNIFRCTELSGCHSCFPDGSYLEFCINNNVGPQQAGNHRWERRQQSESSSGERRWGNRSNSGSRPNRKNMGGGSSSKRNMYRSRSESSSSSSSSRNSKKPGKPKGGGRSSRKRSKHSNKRRSRGGSTWGSRGRSSSKNRGGGSRGSSSSKG